MFITSLRHFLQEYVTPSLFLGEKEKKKRTRNALHVYTECRLEVDCCVARGTLWLHLHGKTVGRCQLSDHALSLLVANSSELEAVQSF